MIHSSFESHGLFFSLEIDPGESSLKKLGIQKQPEALTFVNSELTDKLGLEVQRQMKAYLDGRLEEFELPLSPEGTSFQKNVWDKLAQIPYGQTCSYKDLAQMVGSPKAYQAVGQANGANPIPLVIPCHRVLTNKKGLGGYSLGLDLKKYFLGIEGIAGF